MLYIIIMFIIWNWGLTPLWVNVTVTVLAALGILFDEEDHRKIIIKTTSNDEGDK